MDTPRPPLNISLRSELLQIYNTSGVLDPRLTDEPVQWKEGEYLLDWFWELGASRSFVSIGMGGGRHAPLSYVEMESWAFLRKLELTSWEVQAIKTLDGVYLSVVNKQTAG